MTPSEELRAIFEADQADRLDEVLPPDLADRDRARRRRVTELLAAGAASTDDLYHAAMVFQHGDKADDWRRAHELALRSAELGHPDARWLAAAAYDRWLMGQGRPQKYGTQYRPVGNRWELYDVDPATTDAERARWNVPPLAEARRRAEEITHSPGITLPTTEELAHCRVGDVDVRIRRLPTGMPLVKPPMPAPIAPGDPVPWLPEGLTPRRLDAVFAAYGGGDGDEPAITWHHQPELPGQGLLIFWPNDYEHPRLEVIEVEGRPAAWVGSSGGPGGAVILPVKSGEPWVVAGRLPREQLLRIGASLLLNLRGAS